jgi:oligoendopeptidase F
MRQWLPSWFQVDDWSSVATYVTELLNDKWRNFSDFQRWLRRLNELETAIKEQATWKIIRYLQNTQDEDSRSDYEHYIEEIKPRFTKALYYIYKRYWYSSWRSWSPKLYKTVHV